MIVNDDLFDYIISNSDKYLHDLWADENNIGLFYDLLHLIKCDGYRKSISKETRVWPTVEEGTISPQEFQAAGIQRSCFFKGRQTKMHDEVPLKMFTPEHCHKLFDDEKYDLCLAILPSTYITEAVMNKEITREQRLNYLTIGFCILALFHRDLLREKTGGQSDSNIEGSDLTLYNLDYVKKYLSLAYSLSRQTYDGRCCRLGSLGTHLLEHFFGANRRLNNGNDTHQNFVRVIRFQLLSSFIQKEMNVNFTQKKRCGESGATISATTENISPITLSTALIIAFGFIFLTSAKHNSSETLSIVESMITNEEMISAEFLKQFLPVTRSAVRSKVPTLRNEGITMVGGKANDKRYARFSSLDHVFVSDDEEYSYSSDDDDYSDSSSSDYSSDSDDE